MESENKENVLKRKASEEPETIKRVKLAQSPVKSVLKPSLTATRPTLTTRSTLSRTTPSTSTITRSTITKPVVSRPTTITKPAITKPVVSRPSTTRPVTTATSTIKRTTTSSSIAPKVTSDKGRLETMEEITKMLREKVSNSDSTIQGVRDQIAESQKRGNI